MKVWTFDVRVKGISSLPPLFFVATEDEVAAWRLARKILTEKLGRTDFSLRLAKNEIDELYQVDL